MPFSRLCLNSHKILKILLLHRGPADKPPPHPKGALAQLVEHLHGMQGVSGSNPLRSTTFFEVVPAKAYVSDRWAMPLLREAGIKMVARWCNKKAARLIILGKNPLNPRRLSRTACRVAT
jgi:hypothetical protein